MHIGSTGFIKADEMSDAVISIACPWCGQGFRLSPTALGKTAKCRCQKTFKVEVPAGGHATEMIDPSEIVQVRGPIHAPASIAPPIAHQAAPPDPARQPPVPRASIPAMSAPPPRPPMAHIPPPTPPAIPTPPAPPAQWAPPKPREPEVLTKTVGTGISGAKYAEVEVRLSSIHGTFRSDQFSCRYVLSGDGRRVFHSGGPRGVFGMLMNAMAHETDYVVNGQPFEPPGFTGLFTFSPDGKHYAYTARREGKVVVVVDDKVVSDGYETASNLLLGDEPSNWACRVQISGGFHVVHSGTVGPRFDAIEDDSLEMTADGKVIGYIAKKNLQKYAVLGDQMIPVTDEMIAGAKAGRHRFAFQKTGSGTCLVIDGTPGPSFEKVDESSLAWAADGDHVAYAAKRDGKWHVVRDGEIGPAYAKIDAKSLCFSPDGKKFAYAACAQTSWISGGDWRVVLDGVDQPIYRAVGNLTFAPAGDSFAYTAQSKKGMHFVLNGVESGCWKEISDLQFSPDGRRHVYIGTDIVGKKALVIDGQPGNFYEELSGVIFSPDGSHVAAMAFGEKHSDPKPKFWSTDVKRTGGFLLLDNDYEQSSWLVLGSGQHSMNRAIRLKFDGDRQVYAVSMFANSSTIAFDRVEVEWS